MTQRTRIVIVLLGLAAVAALAGGAVFVTGLGAAEDRETAAQLQIWRTAEVDPAVPAFPALPTADTLPLGFSDAQRESALLWLEQQAHVTDCMVDAGFTNFRTVAIWQPGRPSGAQIAWQEGLSDAELERSATVWYGGDPTNGNGADYDWERGGCNGYGWHMVGLDHPY